MWSSCLHDADLTFKCMGERDQERSCAFCKKSIQDDRTERTVCFHIWYEHSKTITSPQSFLSCLNYVHHRLLSQILTSPHSEVPQHSGCKERSWILFLFLTFSYQMPLVIAFLPESGMWHSQSVHPHRALILPVASGFNCMASSSHAGDVCSLSRSLEVMTCHMTCRATELNYFGSQGWSTALLFRSLLYGVTQNDLDWRGP